MDEDLTEAAASGPEAAGPDAARPDETVTLWDAPAGRWWPTVPVLYAVGGTALTVLLAVLTRLNPWSLLAMLFVPYGLQTVSAARTRVRLTPVGIEVRGLRTRVHPYADVASVEVAPDWDGSHAVWVRLRSSPSSAEPEVLTPPPGWTRTSGRTLADVVDAIRARAEAC